MAALPPIPAAEKSPDAATLRQGLLALRLELEAESRPERRAHLAFELARTAELAGDLPAAARDALAAANATTGFTEALELLVRIAHARGSSTNLEKLLERLFLIAPDEAGKERAGLEWVAHHLEKKDFDAARSVLDELGAALPRSGSVALFRQVLSAAAEDFAGLEESSPARLETTGDARVRALLLERQALSRAQPDEASRELERVLAERPNWRVARRLSRLWLENGRAEEARGLLAELARWLEEAAQNPASAQEREIPARSLTPTSLRELTLERAWAALEAERPDEAEALLEGLSREDRSLFVSALLGVVRTSSDPDPTSQRRARLALLDELRRREETSFTDRKGLALLVAWLSSELEEELPSEVLDAAKEGETGTWGARLLELRQCARGADSAGCAQVLLELSSGAGGKLRAELLATAALLLLSEDVSGAMRLFEQARDSGLDPHAVRRLLRVLAALTEKPELLHAADRALLEEDPSREALVWEALGLARRSSPEAWQRALARLPEESWERVIAAAFAAPSDPSAAPRDEVLARFARSEAIPAELRRALALVQVGRELSSSHPEAREAALARLRTLAEGHPEDRLITSVFSELLLEGEPLGGARALLRFAEHASPTEKDEDRLRALLAFLRTERTPEILESLGALGEPGATPLAEGERHLLAALGKPAVVRALALEEKELERGSSEAIFRAARRELGATPFGRLEELARAVERADGDGSAPAGAGWLALLLAGSRSLDELERIVALLPPGFIEDEELALLRFSLHREAPNEQQLAAAERWLESARSLPDEHPSARDAAWTLLLLATTSGDPRAFVDAERALAALEDDPLLEADALLRLPRETEGDAAAEQLAASALRHPARVELTWAALERAARSEPELLEQLARGLTSTEPDDAREPDPDALAARLLLAFHELTNGGKERALELFAALEGELPHDPAVLVGLRAAAHACGRAEEEARAASLLARKCESNERAARLWERAGDLYAGALEEPERAEEAYRAALERKPESTHAFTCLYRLARARKDRVRLLELVEARLALTSDPEAQVELLWDRARLAHKLGRKATPLVAVERLLELAPDHPGALAVAAEVHWTDGRPDRAAPALRTLALLPSLEPGARELFGLHAVEVLEELDRPGEAVELLENLESFGVPRASLREPLAHAAVRAGAWQIAHQAFGEIEVESTDPDAKLASARMLLAIERDHLGAAEAALETARRVLAAAPLDDDAIEVIVQSELPLDERRRLLGPALEQARRELRDTPLQKASLKRLIERARASEATRLLAIGLGTATLSGSSTAEEETLFERTRAALEGTPSGGLEPSDHELLVDPTELGPLGRFAQLLGPLVAQLTEPSLESLGVTPLLRVDPFGDHPARRAIAAWAGFLGIGDFELYLGGDDPSRIVALAREFPTVVLGRDVPLPLGPRDRVRLVVSLWGVLRGVDVFLKLPLAEARLWMSAARRAIEEDDAPGGEDPEAARARALAEILPRETKERLLEEARLAPQPLEHFPLAVRSSAARLAVLLGGDPSSLRHLPRLIPDEPEERRGFLGEIVRFSLSEELDALRTKVGLP